MSDTTMQEEQGESFVQNLSLRGFVRVTTVDKATGLVTQDTGYVKNKITAEGFQYMVCNVGLGTSATANQSRPSYLGLGSNGAISSTFTNFGTTGTAIGLTSTENKSSYYQRSFVRTTDGGIIRILGTWPGSAFVNTGTNGSFNAVALFHSSEATRHALCAATFNAVTWSSANDVWLTYDLKFSQGTS